MDIETQIPNARYRKDIANRLLVPCEGPILVGQALAWKPVV